MKSTLVHFLAVSFLMMGVALQAAPARLLCEWHEDEGRGAMPAVPGLDGVDSFT